MPKSRNEPSGNPDSRAHARPRPPRRILTPLAEFLRTEAAGGVVLLGATVVALVWANVAPDAYGDFWHTSLRIGFGDRSIGRSKRACSIG